MRIFSPALRFTDDHRPLARPVRRYQGWHRGDRANNFIVELQQLLPPCIPLTNPPNWAHFGHSRECSAAFQAGWEGLFPGQLARGLDSESSCFDLWSNRDLEVLVFVVLG